MVNAQTIIERVRALAEPVLRSEGLELVDVHYRRERGGWVLRLFIDRSTELGGPTAGNPGLSGVTIDDCADASREIGRVLDVEEIVPGSYTLEVSSPGLDRRLTKPTDFSRFAGRLIRTKISGPQGRRTIVGRLIGLEGDLIKVEIKGGVVDVPFQQTEWVRLEPEVEWKRN